MGAQIGGLGEAGVGDKLAPLAVLGMMGCGEEACSRHCVMPPAFQRWGWCQDSFSGQDPYLRLYVSPLPGMPDSKATAKRCPLMLTLFPGWGLSLLEWFMGGIRSFLTVLETSQAGRPWPDIYPGMSVHLSFSVFPEYPVDKFSTTRDHPATLNHEGLRQH